MDPVVQMSLMLAGLLLLGALGEFIFSRTGIPDMIWLGRRSSLDHAVLSRRSDDA